jgi:catechol 2,3-dioxygenase-like lactoylglutathione lyase family enzyme
MEIKYHSSVVFVKDIELMKSFYIDVIGLEVNYDFGSNMMFRNGFSLWSIGENHRIHNKVKASAEAGNTFELYFETEHIDQVAQILNSTRLNFLHELIEEPWGQRTIRFFDPEENLLEIAESLHGFVSRMRTEGMSVDAIAEKTGIKSDDVKKIIS